MLQEKRKTYYNSTNYDIEQGLQFNLPETATIEAYCWKTYSR
jgi:hypothetical protein